MKTTEAPKRLYNGAAIAPADMHRGYASWSDEDLARSGIQGGNCRDKGWMAMLDLAVEYSRKRGCSLAMARLICDAAASGLPVEITYKPNSETILRETVIITHLFIGGDRPHYGMGIRRWGGSTTIVADWIVSANTPDSGHDALIRGEWFDCTTRTVNEPVLWEPEPTE